MNFMRCGLRIPPSRPASWSRSLFANRPRSFPRVRGLSQSRHLNTVSSVEEPLSETLLKGSRSLRPILESAVLLQHIRCSDLDLANSLLFQVALAFSGSVYVLAARETNKDTLKWSKIIRTFSISWAAIPPTTIELMNARHVALRDWFVKGMESFKDQSFGVPSLVKLELARAYVLFANAWLSTSEARRTCYGITAINTLVFLAWQIPRLRPAMQRHFTHNPLSGVSYTLLTSMFSHQAFLHLAFNSLALLSFGAAFSMADSQRPNVFHLPHSTDSYHFLAFYLFAGLFSGSLSHLAATRIKLPRLISVLSDPIRSKTLSASQLAIHPSLGASGAIYGIVAITALAMPETNISLVFLPMYSFPITVGLSGMVALDMLGIIRGWQTFDHWAHLGGAAAGAAYFFYAPWEYVRRKVGPDRI